MFPDHIFNVGITAIKDGVVVKEPKGLGLGQEGIFAMWWVRPRFQQWMHALLTLSKAFFGMNNRSKWWGRCQGITMSELDSVRAWHFWVLLFKMTREVGGRRERYICSFLISFLFSNKPHRNTMRTVAQRDLSLRSTRVFSSTAHYSQPCRSKQWWRGFASIANPSTLVLSNGPIVFSYCPLLCPSKRWWGAFGLNATSLPSFQTTSSICAHR